MENYPNKTTITYLKLRRWAKRRCGSTKAGSDKYWTTIGGNNWVFATRKGDVNLLRLLNHQDFSCSSNGYVKVKGDKSSYDGDLVYWSSRKGKHPELPNCMAYLLKKQKGQCSWCGFHFHDWVVIEDDHIIPKALGGGNEWKNRQLLHRHCHDQKTSGDMTEIWKKETSRFFDEINKLLDKYQWGWINDIPVSCGYKITRSEVL